MNTIIKILAYAAFVIFAIDSNSVAASGSIPSSMHGTWDISSGACKRDDGEEHTVIKSNFISQHESRCSLKKIKASSKNKFVGSFACGGEGETWTDTYSLELTGGKLLRKDESGEFTVFVKCGKQ